VAEKRGFRAAAAELRLTPSAISQAVRALEERVGVQLLQRTTRSVGLTEAGEHFVAQVRPAMDSISEAFDALGEARDRPAGNLSSSRRSLPSSESTPTFASTSAPTMRSPTSSPTGSTRGCGSARPSSAKWWRCA
jgi:DNA-binding transcriptional LysR family regulator